MTQANRRRASPSTSDLEAVRLKQRGRDAIAKIITVESQFATLQTAELRFVVGLLEWIADMPTGGAK